MTTKTNLQMALTKVPEIRTIQEGEDFIKELDKMIITGNGHVSKQTMINRRTALKCKVLRLINAIKTRNNKKHWQEICFGDLPPGAIFYANLDLNVKDASKTVAGRKTYGAKMKQNGKLVHGRKRYALMKSAGEACFIVSKGIDQGSLLSLPMDNIVITRSESKVLMGDHLNEVDTKPSDEWEGI